MVGPCFILWTMTTIVNYEYLFICDNQPINNQHASYSTVGVYVYVCFPKLSPKKDNTHVGAPGSGSRQRVVWPLFTRVFSDLGGFMTLHEANMQAHTGMLSLLLITNS